MDELLNITPVIFESSSSSGSNSSVDGSEFYPDLTQRLQRAYLLFSSVRIVLYFYFSSVSFVQIIYLYKEESSVSLRLILAKFLVFLYIGLFCSFRVVALLIRLPNEIHIYQMISTYGATGIAYQVIFQCGTLLVLLSWTSIGFYWLHLMYVLQQKQRKVDRLLFIFKIIQGLIFLWMAILGLSYGLVPQRKNENISRVTSILFYSLVVIFGIYFTFQGRRLLFQLRKMMKSSWGKTHSDIHLKRTILLLVCLLVITLAIVLKTLFSLFVFKENFINQWKSDFISMVIELVMAGVIMAGVSGSSPARMYIYQDASKFEEKKSTDSEMSSKHSDKSKSSSSGESSSKVESLANTTSIASSSISSNLLDESAINSSDINI